MSRHRIPKPTRAGWSDYNLTPFEGNVSATACIGDCCGRSSRFYRQRGKSVKTTRGHLKQRLQRNEPNDKRITRPSRYGNPFEINDPHPDTGRAMTRDDVCNLFEERCLPLLNVEPLRGKRLLCNCKPDHRCHADSIIAKLEATNTNVSHHLYALAG
jgi:hypothetical protein